MASYFLNCRWSDLGKAFLNPSRTSCSRPAPYPLGTHVPR